MSLRGSACRLVLLTFLPSKPFSHWPARGRSRAAWLISTVAQLDCSTPMSGRLAPASSGDVRRTEQDRRSAMPEITGSYPQDAEKYGISLGHFLVTKPRRTASSLAVRRVRIPPSPPHFHRETENSRPVFGPDCGPNRATSFPENQAKTGFDLGTFSRQKKATRAAKDDVLMAFSRVLFPWTIGLAGALKGEHCPRRRTLSEGESR